MPTSHTAPDEFDMKARFLHWPRSKKDLEGTQEGDEDEATSWYDMNWDDKRSVFILLLLYTLQGIPMGLSASIPMIMKENGASYHDLSLFSLVSVPFSLKLLWAPLVDSTYIARMGRRKTWLIPVQLLCGFMMLYGSIGINLWINSDGSRESGPDVKTLTSFFTVLYFLMATQDIAVDGWALTMLSRGNVGYASSCNAIGQVLGFFFANQGFIVLSDQKWCHKFLGLSDPLFDLASFMTFWGAVFIILTLLVWAFKTELALDTADEPEGVVETYKQMWSISQLKHVRTFILVLMTSRIALAPNDSVSLFKMQEYGMPKEDIATLSPFLLLLSLALPAVISKYLAKQPMKMYLYGIQFKLLTSFLMWCVFRLSIGEYGNKEDGPSMVFYSMLLMVMALNELAGNLIFGAQMTFFAKIADPLIGGTYMTFLNTISNLGSKWPNFLSLWILPSLTLSSCVMNQDESFGSVLMDTSFCLDSEEQCHKLGGKCVITADGYTVEQCLATLFGVLWVVLLSKKILNLEKEPSSVWLTTGSKSV